jgi:hypothetical protein
VDVNRFSYGQFKEQPRQCQQIAQLVIGKLPLIYPKTDSIHHLTGKLPLILLPTFNGYLIKGRVDNLIIGEA